MAREVWVLDQVPAHATNGAEPGAACSAPAGSGGCWRGEPGLAGGELVEDSERAVTLLAGGRDLAADLEVALRAGIGAPAP